MIQLQALLIYFYFLIKFHFRVSNKQSELAGFEGVIDTIHGKTCLVVFGPRASKVVKTSHLEILSSQNSGVAQPEHPSNPDPKKAKLDSSDGH